MDSHTILHTSGSLLSMLNKKYGENRVKLNISLKRCHIPSSLEEMLTDEFILKTA